MFYLVYCITVFDCSSLFCKAHNRRFSLISKSVTSAGDTATPILADTGLNKPLYTVRLRSQWRRRTLPYTSPDTDQALLLPLRLEQ